MSERVTHPRVCPVCSGTGEGCACDDGEVMTDSMREQAARAGTPDPKWLRGECPDCGQDVVSNMYYIRGKGYLLVWQCWASLGENPTCTYRRVL